MSKWNKHALEKKNRFWEKISLRELRTLRSNIALLPMFSFHPVSTDDVKKVIRDLKNNKSVGGETTTQMLKQKWFYIWYNY